MARGNVSLKVAADVEMLNALAEKAGKACTKGLYNGAGIVAQALSAAIAELPFKPSTKAQIQGAIGIAKFRATADGIDTSIGFDGYFEAGFPIPYFVNLVSKGTSTIPANPFLKRASRAAVAQAQAIIDATIQQELDKT